jgi:hypothetical protein
MRLNPINKTLLPIPLNSSRLKGINGVAQIEKRKPKSQTDLPAYLRKQYDGGIPGIVP